MFKANKNIYFKISEIYVLQYFSVKSISHLFCVGSQI